MIHALATLAGIADGSGRPLVAAGRLLSPGTLMRAHVSTRATAIGTDGVTWQTFAGDAPRQQGAAQRLLIEGQRVNGIRNPRAEGGVNGLIGSTGTMPTNYSLTTVAGVSFERVGVVTVNGVTCLRLRIVGTATASASAFLFLETTTGIAAATGQTWTQSVFLRLQASAGAVPAVQLRPISRTSAGAQLTAFSGTSRTLTAALTRFAATVTIADATAGAVQPTLAFPIVTGTTYDATIDVGWPQMEQGGFASTPIVPVAGVSVSSTRGAELVTASLALLAIGGTGACTVLWGGVIPQAAGTAPQTLFQVDAGDGNRFILMNDVGGSSIVIARSLAGSVVAATAGTMVAGTAFRTGITLNGNGRAAASVNGAAAVAVTGGPTGGLTTLRLGNNAASDAAMFGETRVLRVLSRAVSDSELSAWTAAPLY